MVYPKRKNPVPYSGTDSDDLGEKLGMPVSPRLSGDHTQRKLASQPELRTQNALLNNSVPWAMWAEACVVRQLPPNSNIPPGGGGAS